MDTPNFDGGLFFRTISSCRDVFLSEHAHLSESDRHQLWTQQLAPFISASFETGSTSPDTGDSLASGMMSRSNSHIGLSLSNSGSNNNNNFNITGVGVKNVNLGKRTRQDAPRTGSGVSPAKRQATVCLLGPLFQLSLRSSVPSLLPQHPSWNLTIGRLRNPTVPSMNRSPPHFRPSTTR
jgi:hypothetical protein